MGDTGIISLANKDTDQMLRGSFAEWAELWGRLGLWLSLWDERGEMIEQSGQAGTFWKALVRHSRHCREQFRHQARQAQQGETLVSELDAQGGALVLAVPLKNKRRVVGSVLACGLTHDFFDQENFARFCSRYELDEQVFRRIAADMPRHSREDLQNFASILAHHASASSAQFLVNREIHDLSAHLAHTYEELNLIYRLSAGMSVDKNPARHFEELCEELLRTTAVKAFAVVLEPPEYLMVQPTIVRSGEVNCRPDELLRVYQQVRDRPANAGEALVISDLAHDPSLAWASGWLGQLVFYRLEKKGREFGGLLALNHVDESQFDSYEIQLINAVAERSAAFLESVQLYEELERLFTGLVHALVSSIDAKDPYTCGHSQRVAWLARYIARISGITAEKCERVYLSGLLHDIGKIGISEAVLCKTGRLTREEFEEMRRHPEIGARIVEGVPQVADTIPGILHHHERLDGKGYPSRLSGYEIPVFGRIVGLADSYDAMTTNRTYRKARPVQMAITEIRRCAGTQFDPELAELLLQQDMHSVHRELTEFGNQPIGTHLNVVRPAGQGGTA